MKANTRRTRAPAAGSGEERILRAAKRVFVRDGGNAFSARGVAKEAGVTLGGVQHFFRTTEALLAATLQYVLADIRRGYDRLQEELPFNPEARLLGVVDILVEDACREDSRKFFLGLHALSCHNGFAGRLLNDMCRHHQERIAGFIAAARPDLDREQCLDLALQVAAMLDGLMIYTGPGCRTVSPRERLRTVVRDNVRRMVAGAATSAA